MGVLSLGIKVLVGLALLAGVLWLGRRISAGDREEKGRPGRKSGRDRRSRRTPVPHDRRKEPRRQEEVAEAFLDDLDPR